MLQLFYLLGIHEISNTIRNEQIGILSSDETDGAANESDRHRKKLRSVKSAEKKQNV